MEFIYDCSVDNPYGSSNTFIYYKINHIGLYEKNINRGDKTYKMVVSFGDLEPKHCLYRYNGKNWYFRKFTKHYGDCFELLQTDTKYTRHLKSLVIEYNRNLKLKKILKEI